VARGSVTRRPDRGADCWMLRVYVGRDAHGRVRHQSRAFRGSARDAKFALAEMLIEHAGEPGQGSEVPVDWGRTTTINQAIAAWRENGWEDLSPTSQRRYETSWNQHVRDDIGRRRISSLTPYEVERYFRKLKAQGLSEGSVRHVRALLHRACRLARKWSGNRLPNPIEGTELPDWKLDERAKEVRSPAPDEVRALMAAANELDARVGAFMRLVAATGLRRGEACALRWSDVDVDSSSVSVHHAVISAPGGAVLKAPKTRASTRRLTIDVGTLSTLLDLRVEQEKVGASCGLSSTDQAFIFAAEPPFIDPPHPDAMSHAFTKVRTRAGVAADVHLHSLRHFHATVLDPVISEAQKQSRLGWSTVQMARHYTDSVGSEDQRAAEWVGRVLDGDDEEPRSGNTSLR
jgi:integrase